MEFKDLLKTTEGAVVLGGLFATVVFGKMFAWITGVAYVALNVPKVLAWIKSKYNSIKKEI
tara:strand:- start:238 stop:420 length:183 start_codon:yes stop_codon:yes gene_type:complete